MKAYERITFSIPSWLADELRTAYPYMEFSALLVQLLMYAHAAGFMKNINDIDSEDYQSLMAVCKTFSQQTGVGKRTKARKEKMVSQAATEIEEFGSM